MASTLTTTMTVRVLSFAQLRDRLGGEHVLSLPQGSSGHALINILRQRYPAAGPLLEVSRLAVNCDYVAEDVVLRDGDEVVIIPPVSGG